MPAELFTVTVTGDRELIAKLTSMPENVRLAITQKIQMLTLMLQAKVQTEHLSGPTGDHTLSVKSGNLRRSVFQNVESSSVAVIGTVGFSADVVYAAIHEFGGTIDIPEIVPDKAKALYFLMGGQEVFASRVRAHTIVIPERAPLRTSLAEMSAFIREQLEETVVAAFRAT